MAVLVVATVAEVVVVAATAAGMGDTTEAGKARVARKRAEAARASLVERTIAEVTGGEDWVMEDAPASVRAVPAMLAVRAKAVVEMALKGWVRGAEGAVVGGLMAVGLMAVGLMATAMVA